MALFAKLLGLDPGGREALGETLERASGVHEFLADAFEAWKDTDLVGAIADAAPWSAPLVGALGDALPPVRFVIKLFEGLAEENDPEVLGYLACTLAYQQAIEQAVRGMGLEVGAPPKAKRRLAELRGTMPPERYDFNRFSLGSARQHDFVRDSARYLDAFGLAVGLEEPVRLRLREEVHARFAGNLKSILSHGKTRERFEPFRELLSLGSNEERAHDALLEHRDYQRWLYEEQPVLGREPFALQHVYVETDCGVLRWGEVLEHNRSGTAEKLDPFDEEVGGREPLIDTVLGMISDREFDDAIVIQGVAGSGKSSMTLRLCWELIDRGLRPIRIELKDLDTRESAPSEEALPAAVRITDEDRTPNAIDHYFGNELFLDNEIFDETVTVDGREISPYVLILDGWDEISISASIGYQQQVERMLRDVRETFLRRRATPVRVILTGRPTEAIEQSKFLRSDSVLLTVRPLTPDQLESYTGRVSEALERRPVEVEGADPWTLGEGGGLHAALDRYREDPSSSVEVLGLPLLALLALRLFGELPNGAEFLVDDTTRLYRKLVDLVIEKGGKPEAVEYDATEKPQITGEQLRELLRGTAEAMTVLGEESLPREELLIRLGLTDDQLDERVDRLGGEEALSRLMISFFFKGGRRELGCEFCHKSFREYLFAEQVVECVKAYAREAEPGLRERREDEAWKEFSDGDPRRGLCHRLIDLLGPQWISDEVADHLDSLLRLEIGRAMGRDELDGIGSPSPALSHDRWRIARDGLADAWDWWAEGVHLRPQPVWRRRGAELDFEPPEVLRVVEEDRPLAGRRPDAAPIPPRTTSIDSHMGDALFRVVATVHEELALQEGWAADRGDADYVPPWNRCSARGEGPRRYQTTVRFGEESSVLFAPSGPEPAYFRNYRARINAAGYRPGGPFPRGIGWSSLDLRGINVSDLHRGRHESIARANFAGAWFRNTVFEGCDSSDASFEDAVILASYFDRAILARVSLKGCRIQSCAAGYGGGKRIYVHGPNVFVRTDLRDADLRDARLVDTTLLDVNLCHADLRGCGLDGTELYDVDLSGAIVDRELVAVLESMETHGLDDLRIEDGPESGGTSSD